jgi:hypothetical protein
MYIFNIFVDKKYNKNNLLLNKKQLESINHRQNQRGNMEYNLL